MNSDTSHVSGRVECSPSLSCCDFHGFARMQLIHRCYKMYSNSCGLARLRLPNLGERSVWCASASGSCERLFGLPEPSRTCQNVCGAQEQCPESGFDLGRHVWSTAGGTDALSLGPAMLMASMNSSEVALANAFKSASKPFLPMAALVPLSNRMRRTTSPMTAMISGLLKRFWQEATYGTSSVASVYSCSSMSMSRLATSSKSMGRSRSSPGAPSPNHHST